MLFGRLVGVVAFGLGVALTLGACSSPVPNDAGCGPAHPTFRLVVDVEDGAVPDDVRIRVRYGSGEESFEAEGGGEAPKVVFCEVAREASAEDAGQGPIQEVGCDLWTDGAATVWVTARGYVDVTRDLEAERDARCGLVLTDERITLERDAN